MFWNEAEHVRLQAEVCILQTRLSLGFTVSQWETCLKFGLKLNFVSGWLVSPMPCGWCLWVALPGLCSVSRQERREESGKSCLSVLQNLWKVVLRPLATCGRWQCGTWEFLRAEFLEKSEAVWLSPNKEGSEGISTIALPHRSLKPQSQEGSLSKEEESASVTSHTCGLKNPSSPWCEFISMSCSIRKTLPSWQLLDWGLPGTTRHGGWATGILADSSPFLSVTGRAAQPCKSWLDDVAKSM